MKYYNTSLGNCAAPSSGVYQVSNTLIRKPPLVRAPCTAIGIAPLLSARSRPLLLPVRVRHFCAATLDYFSRKGQPPSKLQIRRNLVRRREDSVFSKTIFGSRSFRVFCTLSLTLCLLLERAIQEESPATINYYQEHAPHDESESAENLSHRFEVEHQGGRECPGEETV